MTAGHECVSGAGVEQCLHHGGSGHADQCHTRERQGKNCLHPGQGETIFSSIHNDSFSCGLVGRVLHSVKGSACIQVTGQDP